MVFLCQYYRSVTGGDDTGVYGFGGLGGPLMPRVGMRPQSFANCELAWLAFLP